MYICILTIKSFLHWWAALDKLNCNQLSELSAVPVEFIQYRYSGNFAASFRRESAISVASMRVPSPSEYCVSPRIPPLPQASPGKSIVLLRGIVSSTRCLIALVIGEWRRVLGRLYGLVEVCCIISNLAGCLKKIHSVDLNSFLIERYTRYSYKSLF